MSLQLKRWLRHAGLASGILGTALLVNACDGTKVCAEGDPLCSEDDDIIEIPDTPDCDPIDPSECALPWPSNLYLAESATTATGFALNFGPSSLPKGMRPFQPDAWNGLDGYGVSTPILFKALNLDLSQLPSESNARASWDGEIGQVALLKVEANGELTRVPYWIERDQRQAVEKSLYFLRPAVILEEGTRYIVAMRNLKDTSGATIPRSPAFDALVKNQGAKVPQLANRQARFNSMFDELKSVGIEREELFLAWDFNTISHEALHGPMLKGRELFLADLNGGGPEMTITETTIYQRDDANEPNYHPQIAYAFKGTFRTPMIVKPEKKGFVFNLDSAGELAISGHTDRDFWIRVPYTAIGDANDPAGLMQYGHGLLGYGSQVGGGFNNRIADAYNYIQFASSWTGMSTDDIPAISSVLLDFSLFRYLSDNMHQGILEFMVLAKGMVHTFPTLQEVIDADIQVDTDRLYYNGISQGGIYGATYVAVSPDINVGHLGVPGINYNILLQRSIDFDGYSSISMSSYKNSTNLAIVLAAAQTLWDMTDPASYYRHLSVDPFPGNEEKHVLLAPAKGDYQVSPLTNLIAANSGLGVNVMSGWGEDISHWGLEETPFETNGQPYRGSGIVIYDLGNPWGLHGNITPVDEGKDPHGIPRYFHKHQEQMMHFLENEGEIIDVCNGNGCHFSPLATCDFPHTDSRECWGDD